MTLKEACQHLNIPEYAEAIYNSNSRGELMHLADYVILARHIQNPADFRRAFVHMDEWAKREWTRPASVYQHLIIGMAQSCAQLGLDLGKIVDFEGVRKQCEDEMNAFFTKHKG